MQVAAQPFPWERLPRQSKASAHLQNAARRLWKIKFDETQLKSAVSDLLGLEVGGFGVTTGRATDGPISSLGADVQLSGMGWAAVVSVEPDLVAHVVSRVVGNTPRVDTGALLTQGLLGAYAAVIQQLSRCACRTEPPAVSTKPLLGPLWRTDFWLQLDDAAYRGRLGLRLDGAELGTPRPTRRTTSSLPVSLPVVATTSSTPAELASLEPGDAYLFSKAASLEALLRRGSYLCARTSTAALQVELSDTGLVLRGPTVLHYDRPMSHDEELSDPTVEEAILDAPVEVRVELGSITLPASEWLSLSAGDIITTEIPVGGSAVLTAAGREVARGSLVSVDGQLGIKIDRLVKA